MLATVNDGHATDQGDALFVGVFVWVNSFLWTAMTMSFAAADSR